MDGVYLDLETNPDTADIRRHEIIEIGAVSVEGGVATSTFCSFVRPARPLTERVSSLTGISEAMLEAAPDLRSVLEDFLSFVGDRRLIAHNGFQYDFVILDEALSTLGLRPPRGARFAPWTSHTVYRLTVAKNLSLQSTAPKTSTDAADAGTLQA